jgi:acyl-coenzyme A synthetase/AMP-(fatty) acid ligase
MSLLALTRLLLERRPPMTPVAESGATMMDFARFHADVSANAFRVRQLGCRRGLLVTNDSYWGAVGLFALMHAGAEVIMPQNAQPGTLAAISDAWDLLVCDRALERGGAALVLETGGQGDALAALDPATPLSFFTSGSTGAPKRVSKTLAHLDREAQAVDALLGSIVPRGVRVRSTVTHQHVYGLTFRLCWPLASGRPFTSVSNEYWETALAALNRDEALITSPAHLTRLAGIAPLPPARHPSLVLSAGAPLGDEAAEIAAGVFGVPVTEIFGSTETGAIAWRRRDRAAATWCPLPGVTIESNPDGLLCVRAPHVPGDEYVGSDRVVIEADGNFRFQGRNDSIVKIEGQRVSLPELEEHLRRLPWITDVAVVVLDEAAGQLAAAVVPSTTGAAILAEIGAFRFGRRLRRALAETQEPAGLPRRWRFIDALPSGTLGKRRATDIVRLFTESNAANALPARPTEPEIRVVRPLVDGAEFDLFISADLACFDGHFPRMPIVPGVVQIDWAVKLAARHLNFPIDSAQVFRVKFRRVTFPNTVVTLSLRHTGPWRRLNFQYSSGVEVLSSGSITVNGPQTGAPERERSAGT